MKSGSYWRDKCRPIVARVLKENKGAQEWQIRKALHDAYPFGARKYHPYKIWLDEIKLQRGQKQKKHKAKPVDKDQLSFI
jgi:hypothetical protein